jgi:hypothetical protein
VADSTPPLITLAVEGPSDEIVAKRIIRHVGAEPGPAYGGHGKLNLRDRVSGYARAADYTPWLILVDLDHDQECAPPLLADWHVPDASLLCFRIVVRAVEAWLLADPERFADFFRVSRSRIPADPESLDDPKRSVVDLTRRARRRDIRQDMVPRPGSGRPIGAGYVSRIIEFAEQRWRPDVAMQNAESLRRAVRCLENLMGE